MSRRHHPDPESTVSLLTRRQWLTQLPIPAVAAAAIGAIGARDLSAQSPMPTNSINDLGTRIYNVRDYGAKGDGNALDTDAVQAAIDACTHDGGGTVLVPSGTFQIGTVELKSNVTLHIAASGKLFGSADGRQYHAVDAIPLSGDTTLNDGNWALLFAVDAKNVTLEGPGLIDGQGFQFHSPVRGTPPPSGLDGNSRPYHLLAYRCEGLIVRNIDLLDCAYHSLRIIQSKRVHMDGIYIHNRVNGNNDGFHFISSQYVTVTNCTVLSQDDACALFGSCKFVTITNSVFSTRWSVFRFGGGFVENIAISNCVLYQVYGCPIKFQGNPGSRYENISFSNLVLQDVTGPIHVGVGPRPARATTLGAPVTPSTENYDASTGAPRGTTTPAVLRNLSFSNIHGTVTTDPPQLAEAKVTSTANPRRSTPALRAELRCRCHHGECLAGEYPSGLWRRRYRRRWRAARSPSSRGRVLHARPDACVWALAHEGSASDIAEHPSTGRDCRSSSGGDSRSRAGCCHQRSELSRAIWRGAESALRFIDTTDVLVTAPRLLTPAGVFLQMEGAANEHITVDGGDISSKAHTPLAVTNKAIAATPPRFAPEPPARAFPPTPKPQPTNPIPTHKPPPLPPHTQQHPSNPPLHQKSPSQFTNPPSSPTNQTVPKKPKLQHAR